MWAIMVVRQLMLPRDSLSSMVSLLSLNNTSRNLLLVKKEGEQRKGTTGMRNPNGIPEPIHCTTQQFDTDRQEGFHINEAHFEVHATSDL